MRRELGRELGSNSVRGRVRGDRQKIYLRTRELANSTRELANSTRELANSTRELANSRTPAKI
jgi:hypothetical protein